MPNTIPPHVLAEVEAALVRIYELVEFIEDKLGVKMADTVPLRPKSSRAIPCKPQTQHRRPAS